MTHFTGTLAEAAWAVTLHGLTLEEHGTTETLAGWNALVDLHPDGLFDLGEFDLAEKVRALLPNGALVWIRQTDDGVVTVVDYGTDDHLRSGTDSVGAAWDRFVEQQP